jgi:hypothetical protein
MPSSGAHRAGFDLSAAANVLVHEGARTAAVRCVLGGGAEGFGLHGRDREPEVADALHRDAHHREFDLARAVEVSGGRELLEQKRERREHRVGGGSHGGARVAASRADRQGRELPHGACDIRSFRSELTVLWQGPHGSDVSRLAMRRNVVFGCGYEHNRSARWPTYGNEAGRC